MRIAADVTLYLLALNGLLRVIGVPQGVGIWHLVTRRRRAEVSHANDGGAS